MCCLKINYVFVCIVMFTPGLMPLLQTSNTTIILYHTNPFFSPNIFCVYTSPKK